MILIAEITFSDRLIMFSTRMALRFLCNSVLCNWGKTEFTRHLDKYMQMVALADICRKH